MFFRSLFIRAVKLLQMNNSTLPKAEAQPGELLVSAVAREPKASRAPIKPDFGLMG